MRWSFSYIGGFIIIAMMGFYYLKGLFNLFRFKKFSLILLTIILNYLGFYGLTNLGDNPKLQLFYIVSGSFLLFFTSLLIGLQYTRIKSDGSPNSSQDDFFLSFNKSIILLSISLISFAIGYQYPENKYLSAVLLILFWGTYLKGIGGAIKGLNKLNFG